jgi:hypothetical protein
VDNLFFSPRKRDLRLDTKEEKIKTAKSQLKIVFILLRQNNSRVSQKVLSIHFITRASFETTTQTDFVAYRSTKQFSGS